MQTPHAIRFVRRSILISGNYISGEKPPELTRMVLVPQQFVPVKKFSESKQRMVEFWDWQDIPLVDEKDNLKLADAVQIPFAG